MAENNFWESSAQRLASLSKLPITRQVLFTIILAGTLSLALALVLWSSNEDFVVLYPGLSLQDTAEITAILDREGTEYRIDQSSGLLTVRSSDIQPVKLVLANQGLPRAASGSGFSRLYEDAALGTSQFMEQARFTRALEQELMMTIKLISGVGDARVHLSIPRQSSFLRSTGRASASVMLDLLTGRQLSDIQIAGITRLVASSVAGLDTEDVSIVDQRGSLLSRSADSDFAASSEHFQLTRALEEDYARRVTDILAPIVGFDKVRTQVTAELDFTQMETTEERYDPQSSVIRSEQTTQEAQSSVPVATPGALAPQPPLLDTQAQLPATANTALDTEQNRTSAVRNFEIDKVTSYSKAAPGTIKRLSVAVVVDLGTIDAGQEAVDSTDVDPTNTPAQRLERLRLLVQDTVGFNEDRGDTVFITNESFAPALSALETPALPLWQESWFQGLIKQLAVGLFAVFIATTVLRPALRAVVMPRAAPASLPGPGGLGRQPALTGPGQDSDDDELGETSFQPGAGKLVVGLNTGAAGQAASVRQSTDPVVNEYEQNVSVLQRFVEKEPMRVSRMVGDWARKD